MKLYNTIPKHTKPKFFRKPGDWVLPVAIAGGRAIARRRRAIAPNYRRSIQCLGQGSSVKYFEKEYTITDNMQINIADNFNQPEFRAIAQLYKYMQIDTVVVGLNPNDNNETVKLYMDWDNDSVPIEEVINNDSTKIFTNNAVKIQRQRYRMPNYAITQGKYNFRRYIPISGITYYVTQDKKFRIPGYLYVLGNVTIRIIVKVRFRGSIPITALTAKEFEKIFNSVEEKYTITQFKKADDNKPNPIKIKADNNFRQTMEEINKELETEKVKESIVETQLQEEIQQVEDTLKDNIEKLNRGEIDDPKLEHEIIEECWTRFGKYVPGKKYEDYVLLEASNKIEDVKEEIEEIKSKENVDEEKLSKKQEELEIYKNEYAEKYKQAKQYAEAEIDFYKKNALAIEQQKMDMIIDQFKEDMELAKRYMRGKNYKKNQRRKKKKLADPI